MLLYIILQHKTFHVPSATPMSPPQQNFEISYGSDKFGVLPSSWLFVIDSNLTITHFRLIKYKSVYIMRALRQRKPNSKPTRTTTRCGESRRSSTQRSKDRRDAIYKDSAKHADVKSQQIVRNEILQKSKGSNNKNTNV